MNFPSLVWVDARAKKRRPGISLTLIEDIHIHYIADTDQIWEILPKVRSGLLCFDYDYPDLPGLEMLQKAKQMFPSLPILMLTEYHSEALAIWAFRSRVWDYLVKPFPMQELVGRIQLLKEISAPQYLRDAQPSRQVSIIAAPFPRELCGKGGKTQPAVQYIETHYAERIATLELARLCAMSKTAFGREFKKDHGLGCRDYILRYRIEKARELLCIPGISVTEAAFSVGFNDLSYFTRMFRRHVGVNPSAYQHADGQ